MKHGMRVTITALSLYACTAPVRADNPVGRQLHNLPEAEKPRFEITDRVWPENPGEADICLWKDDKLCAVSFTIDDNSAPDHEWWSEQARKYGFKVTWFVITGRADTGGYWGTWQGWQKLHDEGHDIQSHTVTHLGFVGKPQEDVPDVDSDYGVSIDHLEANVPGNRCIVLAYPGGGNSHMNDRATAEKYFIGARGTTGHINKANRIDYMSTSSLGGGINLSTNQAPWSRFESLLDPSLNRGQNYRGWCCSHFHGVKEEVRPGVERQFQVLKELAADVWIGLFREVVLYGQERDTARLATVPRDGNEIRFSLSDDMDDKLFDFPLTVKVRLPDEWQTVSAIQNGKATEARLIEKDGGRYALVQAIPDRGEVTLRSH